MADNATLEWLAASTAATMSAMNASNGTGDLNMDLDPAQVQMFIEDFKKRQSLYTETSHMVLIACYVPLFLVALFANCLVIFVVFKYHYMRSVTNYFLVNLSFADLLVTLICMPMAVGQNVSKLWVYGEVMCMLTTYFQGVSVSASIFTITAMSIDRYLAIRHPMAFRKVFNRKSTTIVIIALWLVSMCLFAPLLWVLQTEPVNLGQDFAEAVESNGLKFCVENWGKEEDGYRKKVYGAFLFTLVYAIPGTVVMAAYTLMGRRLCAVKPPFDENSTAGSASSQQGSRLVRERRRVARILLVLAVLFALCWLPYNVTMLAMDLIGMDTQQKSQWLFTLLPFTLLLGHCNSAINPLLYCFMTRNFRRTVRGLLTRRRPRPLGTRPQQRCKVPDSSLPAHGVSHGQRHLLERLRFVSQPSQAVLRAKAAHLTRQSGSKCGRSRGEQLRPPAHAAHPPGQWGGAAHQPHQPHQLQQQWAGAGAPGEGRRPAATAGLQPGPALPLNNHHLHTMEDSLSSVPADSDAHALELHHFKFHQTNGSANGIQDHGAP